MTWNPAAYLKYADERTRPAADLLARVPCENPQIVVDLGCGPGNSTNILADRYPRANLIGVDSSPEMLARAGEGGPKTAQWMKADVADWAPKEPVDVFFANALFHWLPERDRVFVRLMQHLKPGGALAIQMPRNEDAPITAVIRKAADEGPWREPLKAMTLRADVDEPRHYHRLLEAHARQRDIWETTYLHALTGQHAIFEWVKTTALNPYLETLQGDLREGFLAAARARIAAAYPREPSGVTLFPFRRIFIVAEV